MASIRVKYRGSSVKDREGTIYYQIIHERKVRQLNTEYRIRADNWNERASMVVDSGESGCRSDLRSIRERIRWDVEHLARIVRKFEGGGMIYTADDVIAEFKRFASEYSLTNYMKGLIARLRLNGRMRTSETYMATLNSFRQFLSSGIVGNVAGPDHDIRLDCITSELMEAYEAWHRQRGNSANTISFYTRILRAVYNRAIENGIIENRNPFRHVYTGVDKTVKRAIPLSLVRKIKTISLSEWPQLDFARDMFLMSFFMRGMSFIDMAFLKKKDLRNGYIVYRRRKTGQQLTIEWTAEMQAILNKYPVYPTPYLLPIIKRPDVNEFYAYRNVSYTINQNLKKIAGMAGIDMPLTMYVARHSWASAAKAKGIPLSVISEGMGHDNEATTQIYLASLDTSRVHKANSLIIASL